MGTAPAPRESALEKHTRKAGREVSGTRSNGEVKKILESKYLVVLGYKSAFIHSNIYQAPTICKVSH